MRADRLHQSAISFGVPVSRGRESTWRPSGSGTEAPKPSPRKLICITLWQGRVDVKRSCPDLRKESSASAIAKAIQFSADAPGVHFRSQSLAPELGRCGPVGQRFQEAAEARARFLSPAHSLGAGIDIRLFPQPVRTSPSACSIPRDSAIDKDLPPARLSGLPAVDGIPNPNSAATDSTPTDTASAVRR